jgi:glucosamine 6-phosphate synthetase-like amidotransferase/phosphosugar isomerase protein
LVVAAGVRKSSQEAARSNGLILGQVLMLNGSCGSRYYAASDASALLQVTRRMIYLEDGDVAELRRDALRIVGAGGTALNVPAVFVRQ